MSAIWSWWGHAWARANKNQRDDGQRLGVAVPDGFDKHAPALKDCKVGFEWVLAVPEWDWKEDVSMRVKDLVDKRDIPLPRCSVTRQKLVDLAQRAAQTVSATYGIDTSCTCPGGGCFTV